MLSKYYYPYEIIVVDKDETNTQLRRRSEEIILNHFWL